MTAINNPELILKNMIKSGRIPGTFLFEGPPGITGVFADMLAKAAVCSDLEYKKESGEACGACFSCVKASRNIHPDIIISEPENDGARSFHIKKVREEIIDGLYLSPNESSKKIYIIKDMQNMGHEGQNALLKSLEEPPSFAMFIITAASLDLILETVKSRAVKFNLTGGAPDFPRDNHGEIIKNILGRNSDKLAVYQDIIKNLEKTGKPGILNFYYNLENAARDVLIIKVFSDNLDGARFLYFSENTELLEKYAGDYSVKKILELCGKIREYKSDLEYNANTRLNLSSFFSAII